MESSVSRHVLIVSHGQPSEPDVGETEIHDFAKAVATHLPEWSVSGATLSGKRTLESKASTMPEGALVYPMFMADGWFTKTVLPERLTAANLRILQPFGTYPGLVSIAARAVLEAAPSPTAAVFLAAHGSGKSLRPAEVTRGFAAQLESSLNMPVHCGFVEQAPYLAEVARTMKAGSVCLPFFATRRGHVLDDLPNALEEARFEGRLLDPVGCLSTTPAFVADTITMAL